MRSIRRRGRGRSRTHEALKSLLEVAPDATMAVSWNGRIIELNLKGTYLPCQAFGRKLLAQRSGSIVNIASIGAFIAYPHASAYNASKGGVLNLTRILALEWIDRGVRVNGIAPGLCDSPLTRARARQSSVTSDFIQARMLRKELILPRELVGAAVFLASDASNFVNGHILYVDGGVTATL